MCICGLSFYRKHVSRISVDQCIEMENNMTDASGGTPTVEIMNVIICLFGIFGFLGNIFVVAVIVKCPALRTYSNYLTASLAIVDYISSMILVMTLILTRSPLLFKIMMYLTVTSLTHLLAMSVDKYLLITRPFSFQTIKKIMLFICLAWAIPLITLADVPNLITDIIIVVCKNTGFSLTIITILHQTICLVIYFTIIALNFRIYITARKQFRQINDAVPGHIRQAKTNSVTWKATKTTMIVIGAFMVCSTPYFAFIMLSSFCCELPDLLEYVLYPAMSVGPVLNPVIYTIRRQEFQNAARNVIRKIKNQF
ncbi:5-hydroxytryptamine receptor 2B-like [Anneissia japonica]|uniref:5-hydroxytryptamine receptor 2B-like n=1 Tax=Anneissia japonica TaxID=1529436 RepID=UPI001425603E|nr:5-hydroxytryptamine receptor 2B-like [Anneissia japonica]